MYEYKRRILLDIYWKLSISFNRIWTKVLIEFGKSASKLNCIILKIVGMKLIFARPILNLSCFETTYFSKFETRKNLVQKNLWSQLLKKKDWIIFPFLPTLIFKKLAIVHHWELQYFVPKLIDFPIALRDQPRDISHIIYKLFSTVNQKKVPNKTQILWEDPSNSCFPSLFQT